MKKEMISYKFRLRLTKFQQLLLLRWMGACRFVYNIGLEQRVIAFQMAGKTVRYYEQQNELVECKKLKGYEWLKEVPSQSLQMSLRNLDRAYQNFFRRVKNGQGGKDAGFPRKKRKGRCVDSISFPQGDRLELVRLTDKKSAVLGLPKLGKSGVKLIQHRPIEGKIKTATITHKSNSDEWYISFSCEKEANNIETHNGELDVNKSIGIDLGVSKTICTDRFDEDTEEGQYSLDVETIRLIEKQITIIQRRMAKQIKFSDRWRYYQRIINKKHSKIARIRQDFLHKTSYVICKNHAIVVMENLKVKNMSKSASGTLENPGKQVAAKSGLNRSILRQGWGMFRGMCEYKSKRFGGHLELVNPQNTSRKCSNRQCGHTSKSNRRTQSEFICEKCGHKENADKNAAKNIKALGLQSLGLMLIEAQASHQSLEAPTIAALAV